jgi:HPt (histidine-containing phosphotransfer) domain-containing protein
LSNHSEYKEFIFNEKIDKDSLSALYEDDYAYIEEIFSITLTQLQPDIARLPVAFKANDLSELKKQVHKIKPSFGFVGMDATQALCKAFEDKCALATNTLSLSVEFEELFRDVTEAAMIIEDELKKLKEYNKS